jgi:methylmalonyl-CoA decarboxylase
MRLVLVDFKDQIGTITFNNPERRNSLSNAMLEDISETIQDLVSKQARVIILRAPTGSTVWSAGFDVRDLPEPGRDPLGYNDELAVAIRAVQMAPCPVIAMIEGTVWGGACDLVISCDLAIGTPNATFAITPAKLGVPYTTTGLMRFAGSMSMHLAKEMFFTAQPIGAQRAWEVGILNHLVEATDLESFTWSLAKKITENSPLAISVMKEQLRILGNSYNMSPETHERIQGLRRKVYDSHDYREGKRAFLEKRKPNYLGK